MCLLFMLLLQVLGEKKHTTGIFHPKNFGYYKYIP